MLVTLLTVNMYTTVQQTLVFHAFTHSSFIYQKNSCCGNPHA